MSAEKGHKSLFKDEVLIYYSQEDSSWVAHSLHTDQIGTGDCVVDSLADLLLAIKGLCDLTQKDETICIFREAPEDIKTQAKQATKLPKEIYEIAHKMALGSWPVEINPHFESSQDKPFKTDIQESCVSV